jgi:hypothetical protein
LSPLLFTLFDVDEEKAVEEFETGEREEREHYAKMDWRVACFDLFVFPVRRLRLYRENTGGDSAHAASEFELRFP